MSIYYILRVLGHRDGEAGVVRVFMLQLEACSLKAKQQGAGGTASALSMVLNVRACVCLSPSSPLSPCLSQSPCPSPVTVRFGIMKVQHTAT